jgi:hypothetical protein
MVCYMGDVLSLNNSKFCEFVDRIYHLEIQIKYITYRARSAAYLDINLNIVSHCWLRMKLYHKKDEFYFPIVNFPFTCGSYHDLRIAVNKETIEPRLPNCYMKVVTSKVLRYHHDFYCYGIYVSQITMDIFLLS